LSEFSSCTRVMRGALHVNPWKISEIATAFYQALTMSEDERMRRVSIASEFVTRVTTQRWALAVMLDLKGVQKNEDAGQYAGAGLGLGFRLLGMDSGFNSLDANSVARAYRNSKSRLILLDYGGTILANDNVSSGSSHMVSSLDYCSWEYNIYTYAFSSLFSWMDYIGSSLLRNLAPHQCRKIA